MARTAVPTAIAALSRRSAAGPGRTPRGPRPAAPRRRLAAAGRRRRRRRRGSLARSRRSGSGPPPAGGRPARRGRRRRRRCPGWRAERAAELGPGLRDPRGCPGPLGRGRGDDQVGGGREHRRQPERDGERGPGQDGQVGAKDPPTWVSTPGRSPPGPARRRSPAPGGPGARIRGARFDPTMKPTADGSDHIPPPVARASTSWRYWATNRK